MFRAFMSLPRMFALLFVSNGARDKYSTRSEARACRQSASSLFWARGQTAGFQVRQGDGNNDRLRAIIFQIADWTQRFPWRGKCLVSLWKASAA